MTLYLLQKDLAASIPKIIHVFYKQSELGYNTS